MNKIILYPFVIFSFLFSQFDLDPRMTGMSEAYTTVASGYQCIGVNPANLALNKSLSMNLFSANLFLINDFMSMKIYNDINGADFENTASVSYYSKSDLLDQIKGDNIELQVGAVLPLPAFNFAYKNFGFSAVNKTYAKFKIPKTILDIMLNGNTKDQRFLLGLGGEGISFNEIALSYGQKFDLGIPIHVGISFKYLMGIIYLEMNDIENGGSYLLTEQTAFHGAGKYLIEQAFGGQGTATDLGIVLPEFYDGWDIGLSLINMGGSIVYSTDNVIRESLGSSFESATNLRQNEYLYFDFLIDTMSIMSAYNSNDEIISSNSYNVGIFSDIPLEDDYDISTDLFYYSVIDGDSILNVVPSYIDADLIVDLGDGSYLVPSENLQNNQLQSKTSKDIHLDYPSSMRFGISKQFENYGILAIDFITGFDNSFGNSNKFRLSVGTEITRINKNFPIRMGFSTGGNNPPSYGLGFGYKFGPVSLDFSRKYYHGLIFNRTKGAQYSFNVSLDLTDIENYKIEFRLPEIKLPKIPQLPDFKF